MQWLCSIISALIDHNFVYYYGIGLYLGHRLSQGVARACHLNTCWIGISGPDLIDYWIEKSKNGILTLLGLSSSSMICNSAQRYGIKGNLVGLTFQCTFI